MNINKLKKEVHLRLIKTDKYICPECGGEGYKKIKSGKGSMLKGDLYKSKCNTCNGSGIHADTSKLLMDIISQLVFALRAWEEGKRADYDGFKTFIKEDFVLGYESCYLNTYEDHISHDFLLLLDFAEYKNIELKIYEGNIEENNMYDNIYEIINCITDNIISLAVSQIIDICKQQNIDLEKHIQARLEYMRSEG